MALNVHECRDRACTTAWWRPRRGGTLALSPPPEECTMTRKLVISGIVVTAVAVATSATAAGKPAPASGTTSGAESVQVRTFVAQRAGWVGGVDLVLDAPNHARVSLELRSVARN